MAKPLRSAILQTGAQVCLTLALYLMGALVMGIAIYPGALLVSWAWTSAASIPALRLFAASLAFGAGYFLFGLTLVLATGALRILLRLNLQPGVYPVQSAGAVRWFVSNALITFVANLFLRFMLLTPFASLFYRLMGAKLGANVQINSDFCADLSLLEIGDDAVIGGHATIIGHVFKRNSLVLKPVKIGSRAVIGLNAILMPGVVIGEGAIVAAGVTVPADTCVPPRTVYAGPEPRAIGAPEAEEDRNGS